MSDRFYFGGPLGRGAVTLDGPEAHHLATVRRFQPGDSVTLFNGDGHEYVSEIVSVGRKRVELQVTNLLSPVRELSFRLHVASALPKGDRGDFLIEKLTELGVTAFTPLITERSIIKIDEAKTDKLRRAVIEASKQCGRNVLMQIFSPARWTDWFPQQSGRRLIAHTKVGEPMPGNPKRSEATGGLTIAIGPEGGFSDEEVAAALAVGWEPFSLGPRILRVETAAIAAALVATAFLNRDAQ
ncbi:MAG TPA: 16S rRNA (uracil(1498)-N(3))-methyltransferase [Gemmataceae bacterium]|nr:16S rRNA (uracil(1498)-N(3))-methyltransferase [Gemmataceae bacterium]